MVPTKEEGGACFGGEDTWSFVIGPASGFIYSDRVEENIRRFGIPVLHGIDRGYDVTFNDPPLDPPENVLMTSGARSSRPIDGNCDRGQSVRHAAVHADEIAYRTPFGRSSIDGGIAEDSEALLSWYREQRRLAALFESASSRQSVVRESTQDLSACCTPKVPFAIVLPTGG